MDTKSKKGKAQALNKMLNNDLVKKKPKTTYVQAFSDSSNDFDEQDHQEKLFRKFSKQASKKIGSMKSSSSKIGSMFSSSKIAKSKSRDKRAKR